MVATKETVQSSTTLRRFGWTLAGMFPLVFGLVAPTLFRHSLPAWPWIVGGILGALALIAPTMLRMPHRIWMGLGAVLHRVNTILIFSLIFFLALFPLNLVFRVMGRDGLRRKWDRDASSYRVSISDSHLVDRMDNLF